MKALLTALALTLCACARPVATEFRPDTRVIFAGENARRLFGHCESVPRTTIEGVWTPTEAEVEAVEPALFRLLNAELERDAATFNEERRHSAEEYYRQYGGLVLHGRRVIYVNGFAGGEHFPGWRYTAPHVCDGGVGLFGVEYDPETHDFGNFYFNAMG